MRIFILFIGLLLTTGATMAQEQVRMVFYNVENLFDPADDPEKNDEEFTPGGRLHWTRTRYTDKLLKIAEVVEVVGAGEWPAGIGLCEVENRKVLEELTEKTAMVSGGYRIVHVESPDHRGIDVAFLYRAAFFEPLRVQSLSVSEDTLLYTRDILYVSAILKGKDTLHLFVCHFPSMTGGELQSEWKRKEAARVVRKQVDSIQQVNPSAAVLIMGDLNGKADRPAQKEVLKTHAPKRRIRDNHLYNTGYYLLHRATAGSYRYQGNWQTIDHLIVSGAMLNGKSPLQAGRRLTVFAPSFLLEEDKNHFGFKPFRTYLGFRYHGGYSDHLPVYTDLFL